MYVGIRDVCLFQAGYENIAEGMAELELGHIELAVDRNMCIPAAEGSLGRPRSLSTSLSIAGLWRECTGTRGRYMSGQL